MLGTTVFQQLTENLGAGEEVRFSIVFQGLQIRRIHGQKELIAIVDRETLDCMKDADGYIGERLWDLAVALRTHCVHPRMVCSATFMGGSEYSTEKHCPDCGFKEVET